MNNKITLPALITMLSQQTGLSKKVCEEFIRELCQMTAGVLEERDTVRIKGLGVFRTVPVQPRRSVDVTSGENIEIAGHLKVSFTPARDLAKAINAPFSAFEAIELPDGLEEESLSITAPKPETEPLSSPTEVKESPVNDVHGDTKNSEVSDVDASESDATDIVVSDVDVPDVETSDIDALNVDTSDTNAQNVETSDIIASNFETSDATDTDDSEHRHTHHHHRSGHRYFSRGFIAGFLSCAIILGAAFAIYYFLWVPKHNEIQAAETFSSTEIEDSSLLALIYDEDTDSDELSEESVPTMPSDAASPDSASGANKVVTDTISRTRFLTTMAKDHYGNFNLWPYIYEENAAKLGHPDRIRPGTPVVIPPLSKYGVDPNNPEDIKTAKNKGASIYARYR